MSRRSRPFWGTTPASTAPGLQDPFAALQASHHLLLAHGLATRAIRAAATGATKIGIALALQPAHPASDSADDRLAAERFDAISNRWYLEPLFRGRYPLELLDFLGPLAPADSSGDLETIATPTDFLGVNYYSRACCASIRPAPWSSWSRGRAWASSRRCGKSTQPGSRNCSFACTATTSRRRS